MGGLVVHFLVLAGVSAGAGTRRDGCSQQDTPRIKYIMFLPNTPLLLLATVVRGVNTLLGRADAVMATARRCAPPQKDQLRLSRKDCATHGH